MNKRMDIYDVAHEWANRTDVNASASSHNLFFARGAIYSYGDHFMIAKHVWNEKGEHAALFTKQTYSRTTSKHVTIVARASSHINKLYVSDPTLNKDEQFNKWYEEIMLLGNGLGTARKPAKYLSQIAHLCLQAKKYADFFGYQIPEALTKVAMVENLAQFADYLKIEREQQEAKEKKERSKQLKAQNKLLKVWRSFKRDYLRTYDGLDYLRFNAKTGQVETTQSVRLPLSAGHQLYQFVNETNAKGGCTNCGQLFLDQYSINEVNKNFIHIGCHKVTIKEIKLFATQQGWC